MRTLLEIAAVLALGAGSGLLANALDERGLELGRQYFPKGAAEAGAGVRAVDGRGEAPPALPAPADAGGRPHGEGTADGGDAPVLPGAASPASPAGGPLDTTPVESGIATAGDVDPALAERLASKGLAGIGFDEAAAAWRDPLRELGAIVFVDARAQQEYEQGHVPGARKLDFYQPDADLAALLPLLPGAMRIVVYCNGGQCEDSESAALLLLGLGADPASLVVYVGGIAEWRQRQMPVATGPTPDGT